VRKGVGIHGRRGAPFTGRPCGGAQTSARVISLQARARPVHWLPDHEQPLCVPQLAMSVIIMQGVTAPEQAVREQP